MKTTTGKAQAATCQASSQASWHPRRARCRKLSKAKVGELARDLFECERTIEELAACYHLAPERLCRIIEGKVHPQVMRLLEALAAAARRRSQLQLAHLQEKSVGLMNRALGDRAAGRPAKGQNGQDGRNDQTSRSGEKPSKEADPRQRQASADAEATNAGPAAKKAPSAASLAVAKDVLQRTMDARAEAAPPARTRRAVASPAAAGPGASQPKWPPSPSERDELLARYGGPVDQPIPD